MRGPDYLPAPLLPSTSTPTTSRKLPANNKNTYYHYKMPAGTPICRCRVLYMGSSVPHITKDGLHGIQEPLRELYPEDGILGALGGIDSWLSVWSNGLLLENVDEKQKKVTRFFPIDSLHYCAAVRHVCVPPPPPAVAATGSPKGPKGPIHRFLPLDSPFARIPTPNNPPLFAAILRRTTGIKVLECHAFVCKKEMAANALVRCCFHAYADNACAQRMHQQDNNIPIYSSVASLGSRPGSRPGSALADHLEESPPEVPKKSQSHGNLLAVMATIESDNNGTVNGGDSTQHLQDEDEDDGTVVDDGSAAGTITYATTNGHNGDENHKIWSASNSSTEDQHSFYGDYATNTLRSATSVAGSTSTRSGRPRQLSCPMAPPPPPPNPPRSRSRESADNQELGDERAKLPRHPMTSRRQQGMPVVPMMHHGSNGYLPVRPPGPGRWMQQHQMQILQRPHNAPPPPPHHAPVMMVPIGPTPPSSVLVTKGGLKAKGKNGRSKEPIYVATGRPMTPLSPHLQQAQMPYEQYLMHQHQMALTLPTNNKKKQQSNGDIFNSGQKVPATPSSAVSAGEKFNTGIYRKKGHLNERAFSYSIRQEHRSRSHNSLSTLAFTNGNHLDDSDSSPVALKKAAATNGNRLSGRMNDLSLSMSLSDDDLEKDGDVEDVSSALSGFRITNGGNNGVWNHATPMTNGSKPAIKMNGNAKLKR